MNTTYKVCMNGRYLIVPICKETPEKVLRIFADGEEITEFSVPAGDPSLAEAQQVTPDFESALNLSAYAGQTLELVGDLPGWFFRGVRVSDELPAAAPNRPLLHWSPYVAWGNDPNGLVYHDGIYEFYYQYNPMNTLWMNMSWAHTRSRDLLHWGSSETALLPDPDGTIYSGYGMRNEGGQYGLPEDALLFFYTRAGDNPHPWDTGKPFDQVMAYSLDGGETLVKSGKVLIPDPKGETSGPRDPSIYRYEPGGFWYIVMYYGHFRSAIWKSEDLEHWSELQVLDLSEYRMRECSDMFRLPREDGSEAWIFWTADGYYLIGTFDGQKFRHDGIRHEAYGDNIAYAAQSYRGIPDSCISLSWLRTESDGQAYRSIYGLPRRFSIGTLDGEERIHHHLIDAFLQQRRLQDEQTDTLRWEAADDCVLDLETVTEGSGDIAWEFPGAKLTYLAREGRLLISGDCRHTFRGEKGITGWEEGDYEFTCPRDARDFSVIYDRGILEITMSKDAWIAYVEMPADRFGGTVTMKAEKSAKTSIYTIA